MGELTPTTCEAPAFAANMLRIPVPHPTSSTVLSLNKCGLFTIADLYVPVLTESLSISSWIPKRNYFSEMSHEKKLQEQRLTEMRIGIGIA